MVDLQGRRLGIWHLPRVSKGSCGSAVWYRQGCYAFAVRLALIQLASLAFYPPHACFMMLMMQL
jgi:hypothetical protein